MAGTDYDCAIIGSGPGGQLLGGETVTLRSDWVHLDEVKLDWPSDKSRRSAWGCAVPRKSRSLPTRPTVAQLTISGTPEDCAQSIRALAPAGANAVLLQPIPGTEREQLPLLAQVVSLLRAA
jgi:alkanesulfonate monooxygenase SsuD/methylene tetrahydromethanopterin reductase-like flavin-dependent oxidoreductase (luciferase family)